MVIRCSQTEDDFIAFNLHCNNSKAKIKKGTKRLMSSFVKMLIALFILDLVLFYNSSGIHWYFYIIFIALAAIYIILYPKIREKHIIKSAIEFTKNSENNKFFCESVLTIADSGIKDESVNGSITLVTWGEIIKYEELEDVFYVYIFSNQALIIPKRVINTEEQNELRNILVQNVKPQQAN